MRNSKRKPKIITSVNDLPVRTLVSGFVVTHVDRGTLTAVPNGWYEDVRDAIAHRNSLAHAFPDECYDVWTSVAALN